MLADMEPLTAVHRQHGAQKLVLQPHSCRLDSVIAFGSHDAHISDRARNVCMSSLENATLRVKTERLSSSAHIEQSWRTGSALPTLHPSECCSWALAFPATQ